ncbi:unnamed protein product [Cuscuta epithymum]|uniref:CCHC-type domain-containing protein n=1 Tax=Cuscuta epithymum TaxID=186058 RepID=A0AAV0CIE2_9ASTE|nr:unnamed protein product [Cuscuta epithymum]
MESIADRYRRMKVAEKETELDCDDAEEGKEDEEVVRPRFSVVGALIADRKISFVGFKEAMTTAWRPGRGVEIKEIEEKRYIFNFNHPVDMKRVVEGGPWQFEKNLLIVKEIKPTNIPHKSILNEAEFWVQVLNVPYGLLNLGNARKVGNFLGKFVDYDKNNNGEHWRPYMRVKVCINVELPLKKGTTLKKDGVEYWVDFQYERLPNFCFICGVMGHSDKFCPLLYEEGLVLEKSFDASLRAGGGVKTNPTGLNKWLIGESSSSEKGSQGWLGQGKEDKGLGDKEDVTDSGSASNKEVVLKQSEEYAGEKRRRTWEVGTTQEQESAEMALDNGKNGEATNLEG